MTKVSALLSRIAEKNKEEMEELKKNSDLTDLEWLILNRAKVVFGGYKIAKIVDGKTVLTDWGEQLAKICHVLQTTLPLLWAVLIGDENEVSRCLTPDVNPYGKDCQFNSQEFSLENGRIITSLFDVLNVNDHEMCKMLLMHVVKHFKNDYVLSCNHKNPIVIAIQKRMSIEFVEELLAFKPNLNRDVKFHDSPLFMAIVHQNREMALLLMKSGAIMPHNFDVDASVFRKGTREYNVIKELRAFHL